MLELFLCSLPWDWFCIWWCHPVVQSGMIYKIVYEIKRYIFLGTVVDLISGLVEVITGWSSNIQVNILVFVNKYWTRWILFGQNLLVKVICAQGRNISLEQLHATLKSFYTVILFMTWWTSFSLFVPDHFYKTIVRESRKDQELVLKDSANLGPYSGDISVRQCERPRMTAHSQVKEHRPKNTQDM